MDIEKILAKKLQDRTAEEIKYLSENKDKLTSEQKEQLKKETKKDVEVLEEIENDFEKQKVAEEMKSNVGKKIYRAFNTEVKDLGNGMMEAVISSEIVDRHGEHIDMKGMNIKEYMKNPIVADAHDYSKPSVGRTHKLTKTSDGKLISKFEWAKDIYDKARLLYNLYKEKFQYAFSIGFIADEVDGTKYVKSTMLEFSPVLIPANPEALLLAKKKGLDITNFVPYNNNHMDIKDILAKAIENLTLAEVKFLKEHISELSADDKSKFASVLEEKDVVAEISKLVDVKLDAFKKELDPVKLANINLGGKKVDPASISKEVKFYHFVKGVLSGNFSKYLEVIGKDAMNTSDDSVLLPPEEFIAEVERLEEQYGVAAADATVRRSTSGKGIKYLMGDDDLEIFDTAESGAKKSTKLSYDFKLLAWRKFAGILPITDELTEDSAIDLWKDATQRFARAYARKGDELVFIETSGASPKNKGILYVSGTKSVVLPGDSIEDLDYDTISKMIWAVPSPSADNGKFYLNREIIGVVQRIKDLDGRPIWQRAMADGTPATILGKPYVATEVLPKLTDDDADLPFIIFGNLKYATLGERTSLVIKLFDSGTVGDPDEVDQEANTLNLLTQDIQVMRAVKRFNAVVRFPAAFSIAVTGPAAS